MYSLELSLLSNIPSIINSLKLGSISYPTEFLPLAIAAIIVVPVPKNGSKTVSPLTEYILIKRYANSNG